MLLTVSGAFVVFILLGCFWLLRNRRNKQPQNRNTERCDSLHIMSKSSTLNSTLRVASSLIDDGLNMAYYISLDEIEYATSKFSKKIGEGSFGPVYYGKMKDGKEVAVKTSIDVSGHGTQQFLNEVALLSRIHHRNLVPLIGYCDEECKQILIYEYMHNGTLREHLHDPVGHKNLDWLSRLIIAEDASRGLAYLHAGCSPRVIHRDVKTSNILLDVNMRAKVSDFGLSRQSEENLTHVSSIPCGTVGYLDPEYYANQQLTDKSDVYSFGIVLLELISGRKPISLEDYGAEWNIVHWARSMIRKGDVASIIDPALKGTFKVESLWRVAEIAILSVEQHGFSRPKMQEVELAIQDAIKIERGDETTYNSSSSTSTNLAEGIRFSFNPLDQIVSFDLASSINLPSVR